MMFLIFSYIGLFLDIKVGCQFFLPQHKVWIKELEKMSNNEKYLVQKMSEIEITQCVVYVIHF